MQVILSRVGGLLDEQLVAARPRRRQEDAVGLVGQALDRSEDADEPIDAVVVRLQVVVADRPVVAEAVEAAAPEVVGAEAQRDAAPVVGAAAEHARAEPVERGCRDRWCRARRRASSRPGRRRTRRTGARGWPRRGAERRRARRTSSSRGAVSHMTPASSITTSAPASVRTLAAMPAAGARADDADVEHAAVADDLHRGPL